MKTYMTIILSLLCFGAKAQSKAKPDTMILLNNNNIRSTHGEPQYAQWSINDKIQYNPFNTFQSLDTPKIVQFYVTPKAKIIMQMSTPSKNGTVTVTIFKIKS